MDLGRKISNLPLPSNASLLEVTTTEFAFNQEFILVGRGFSGSLHLLFKIPKEDFEDSQKQLTNGFNIGFRKLQRGLENPVEHFIEISTIENFDENLFIAIANEIFAECKSRSDLVPLIEEILDRWKYLLSQKLYQRFGSDQAIGLFGELILLKSALSEFGDSAIFNWTGPNRSSHDFEFEDFSLEVKTFFPTNPSKIHIHGLPQMQTVDGKSLYLVTCAVRPTPLGRSLKELVLELEGTIIENLLDFQKKLWSTGYRADNEIVDELRLSVEEIGKTMIDENFPRLNVSESSFESRISELSYVLEIEGLLQTNFLIDLSNFWRP